MLYVVYVSVKRNENLRNELYAYDSRGKPQKSSVVLPLVKNGAATPTGKVTYNQPRDVHCAEALFETEFIRQRLSDSTLKVWQELQDGPLH